MVKGQVLGAACYVTCDDRRIEVLVWRGKDDEVEDEKHRIECQRIINTFRQYIDPTFQVLCSFIPNKYLLARSLVRLNQAKQNLSAFHLSKYT